MNKKRKKRRRSMNHAQRVAYLQSMVIAAVLFAAVLVGAVVLTQKLGDKNEEKETVKTEQESQEKETVKTEQESQEKEEEPQVMKPEERVSVVISAAGDCTLGTDENFDQDRSFVAYYENKGYPGYFFENVKSVFEQDDLTIVNLESVISTSENRADKTFAFKGDPEYTQILTQGSVEAVNLANNHSKDYGMESYEDTIRYLDEAGIQSFGYDRTAIYQARGVKIGLVGIYELADGLERKQQLLDNIQSVKEQGAQLVIVSFHWGTEKENYPDDVQKTLAHAAVDAGADLVLGHHPHVLQGIEEYKGKNIVYSLGNFCFGGNNNPSDKDTMIFQQTFTFENGTLIQDNVKNVIPCRVSSVSDYNDFRPTPAYGEEGERILGRIREYSAGFSTE